MSKEKKLVPKLRFEEFKNSNIWTKNPLTSLVNGIDTGKSSFNSRLVNSIEKPYPILGSRGIIGYDNTYDYEGSFILTARVGENAGNLYKHSGKVKISDNTVYLEAERLNFVYYLLANYDLKKLSFGTGQPLIKANEIRDLNLNMPIEVKEQNKVGSFFEQIDEMIQLQQSKVNKVKDIKSAYLSEMFPKEGEKYPKRRFEGFQGVWRKIRLEQVLNQSGSGGTPRTTREDYYGGDIPFLGISDITNSNGYIFNTEKTITVNGLNNSAAWIVPKESISLAMYASVGKVAILKIKSATSQAFYNMVIKTQPTRDYIFQYLVKMEEENMWDRIISTGTQANLNAEKVRNLIIPIPIDIDEQEKIGSFFKNLDNQIYIEEEKLTKLEKLKQAYLNDMFV